LTGRDEELVSAFTYKIFRLLDLLGHFPMSLRGEEATPSRLEKYPRLLFSYLQRYPDPVMAFKEWESKVLRDTPQDEHNQKKNEIFPLIEETLHWLEERKELFQGKEKKLLIQHLRGSLYARIFAYLYPRRQICLVLAQHQPGFEPERAAQMTVRDFAQMATGHPDLDRLQGVFAEEWPVIIADAKENYLRAAAYYKKVAKSGAENQQ